MKNKNIFIIVFIILLVVIASYFFFPNIRNIKNISQNQSKDFSLNLFVDLTNTKGDLWTQEMNIDYKNDKINYANRTEFRNYRFPTNYRCVEEYNSLNNEWTRTVKENYLDNESCASIPKLYNSLTDINEAIKSGEIIEGKSDCHKKICYSIVYK